MFLVQATGKGIWFYNEKETGMEEIDNGFLTKKKRGWKRSTIWG